MTRNWQDTERTEYAVKIRTPLGTIRIEYRLTQEAAEALREKYDVISIALVTRTLDY